MENKSCAAYAQDLVIRVTGYGILGYHDDVPLSVWNKKFEITNGTHNFVTLIKMTKELKHKIQLIMIMLLDRSV